MYCEVDCTKHKKSGEGRAEDIEWSVFFFKCLGLNVFGSSNPCSLMNQEEQAFILSASVFGERVEAGEVKD